MDSQKQQASERVKQANNILVTVSNNPSVDQLAACIGLTLSLNKMGKHATAVFSGNTPSTIEFLQPEKTLEKNTDSLRDFIIALDKSKADKLRYKVEDRVVKIFITPYRTSISDKDLEFSQGDFNVDVVLAIGVHNQVDLDQAITSHGRILHDATVVTLNTKPGGELGSINWLDPNASSLSELGADLINALDKKLIDGQIATAFLTGIVAETDRFSNSKTSPQTMSISAELMANGANQQLVATKLEEPVAPPPAPTTPIAAQDSANNTSEPSEEPAKKKADDGTLEISHEEDKKAEAEAEPAPQPEANEEKPQQDEPADNKPDPELKPSEESLPAPVVDTEEEKPEAAAPQIHIDEHGAISPISPDPYEGILPPLEPKEPPAIIRHNGDSKMVLEPPTLDGQSSGANGYGEASAGASLPQMEAPHIIPEPTVVPAVAPTITPPQNMGEEAPSGGSAPSDSFIVGQQPPLAAPQPTPNVPIVPAATETLSEIEKQLGSPHATASVPPGPATLPAPTENNSLSASNPVSPTFQPVMVEPQIQPDTNNTLPEVNANDMPDTTPDVSGARDAVAEAFSGANPPLQAIDALNANPLNLPLGAATQPNAYVPPQTDTAPAPPVQPWTPPQDPLQGIDPSVSLPGVPVQGNAPQDNDPNAPPPVPPPMMPPTNPY